MVSLRQIRYWDSTGLVRPSVQAARGRGSRRLYSFEDLLELRVIFRLRNAGLSLQKVRKVTDYLRAHHAEVRRPLANMKLITDGETVYISTDPGVLVDALNRPGQVVMVIVAIGEIWNDMQTEVVRLSDKRNAEVRVQGQRYAVTFERTSRMAGGSRNARPWPDAFPRGTRSRRPRR
jgi:DNA-binding transcriptional MerR regulator